MGRAEMSLNVMEVGALIAGTHPLADVPPGQPNALRTGTRAPGPTRKDSGPRQPGDYLPLMLIEHSIALRTVIPGGYSPTHTHSATVVRAVRCG